MPTTSIVSVDATAEVRFHCHFTQPGAMSLRVQSDPWEITVYLQGTREELIAFANAVVTAAMNAPIREAVTA